MLLDLWQFRCCNDRIVLLNKLASLRLVVVRASVCFGITMQRAEIVPTSKEYIQHYNPLIYSHNYSHKHYGGGLT